MCSLKPPRHISTPLWLCENARTLDDDRRSCVSKTVPSLNLERALNLRYELKNAILAAFRSFAFSHSQGQNAKSWGGPLLTQCGHQPPKRNCVKADPSLFYGYGRLLLHTAALRLGRSQRQRR